VNIQNLSKSLLDIETGEVGCERDAARKREEFKETSCEVFISLYEREASNPDWMLARIC
jgi:hypothetical protein